jgi:soluble lytic murein transglycosylase-like protein
MRLTMRRLILATTISLVTFISCAARPGAASLLEPIAPQWAWPPSEAREAAPRDPIATLPPVLVSAARFGAGFSDALRRVPVPEIADQPNESIEDAFAEAQIEAVADDIPVPRPRVELKPPNVPIEEVCETLADAAQSHRLPVPFFIRLIWQESRFDPGAVSPVGAQGVAQFMPATAAAMGLKNPFNPLEALHFSAQLLRELLSQFGNLGLAAAAYNAGPKRIVDWLERRGNLPEETRNYVRTITGHAAERWRNTKPGRLALAVPKRAPCQALDDMAYMVEVPAPVPVPLPKQRARTKLLAKKKDGDGKPADAAKTDSDKVAGAKKKDDDKRNTAAATKKTSVEISASRKRSKRPAAVRDANASAAKKAGKQRPKRDAKKR